MDKILTAEEFCKEFKPTFKTWQENFHETMIEFAKLHVTKALEEASKEAKTVHDEKLLDEISKGLKSNDFIYKPSILNAYPLTNIQ